MRQHARAPSPTKILTGRGSFERTYLSTTSLQSALLSKEESNKKTYTISLWEHAKYVFAYTNSGLNSLGIKKINSATNAIRMRKSLHLDDILRDGPEAITAMPARIRKDVFGALGVAVETIVTPYVCTGAPAVESQKPFKTGGRHELWYYNRHDSTYLYKKLRS